MSPAQASDAARTGHCVMSGCYLAPRVEPAGPPSCTARSRLINRQRGPCQAEAWEARSCRPPPADAVASLPRGAPPPCRSRSSVLHHLVPGLFPRTRVGRKGHVEYGNHRRTVLTVAVTRGDRDLTKVASRDRTPTPNAYAVAGRTLGHASNSRSLCRICGCQSCLYGSSPRSRLSVEAP